MPKKSASPWFSGLAINLVSNFASLVVGVIVITFLTQVRHGLSPFYSAVLRG